MLEPASCGQGFGDRGQGLPLPAGWDRRFCSYGHCGPWAPRADEPNRRFSATGQSSGPQLHDHRLHGQLRCHVHTQRLPRIPIAVIRSSVSAVELVGHAGRVDPHLLVHQLDRRLLLQGQRRGTMRAGPRALGRVRRAPRGCAARDWPGPRGPEARTGHALDALALRTCTSAAACRSARSPPARTASPRHRPSPPRRCFPPPPYNWPDPTGPAS